MSLQELLRQRREKLARWRALGVEPYPYRFEPTHDAAGLIARGDAVTETPGENVRIAGRTGGVGPGGVTRNVAPITAGSPRPHAVPFRFVSAPRTPRSSPVMPFAPATARNIPTPGSNVAAVTAPSRPRSRNP